MLKKKGMKTTGKKATLMKRLHLKGGATKAVRDAAIAAAKAMPETNDAEKAAKATALAEAELEYEDREDLSVYVDFEAADRAKVAAAFGLITESPAEVAAADTDAEVDESRFLDVTPSFMIWTTTPWTLPANLAIAVHERFRYALVEIDGNTTIMASELVEKVAKKAGAEKVLVRAETDGAKLVGLAYRHPFCAREGRIVAADYVTLEDGTGLVHTAPGHGADD